MEYLAIVLFVIIFRVTIHNIREVKINIFSLFAEFHIPRSSKNVKDRFLEFQFRFMLSHNTNFESLATVFCPHFQMRQPFLQLRS